MQMFLLNFVGVFSGRFVDLGYFRASLTAGCALQVLGIYTTAFATEYWQLFLAQGVCSGLGHGFLFAPIVSILPTYFKKHRAVAVSLATCGAATGGMVFPSIAYSCMDRLGFRWTVLIMAFVVTFNAAMILCFTRTRVKARKPRSLLDLRAFTELPYSLFAVGSFLVLWGVYCKYNLMLLDSPSSPFFPRFRTIPETIIPNLIELTETCISCVLLCKHPFNAQVKGDNCTDMEAGKQVGVFGRSVLDFSLTQSLSVIIVMNGVGIFGRIIPALLADRYFGILNTLIPAVGVAGIVLLGWAGVSSTGGLFGWAVIYGFAANATQSLFPAAVGALSTDPTRVGTRVGMILGVVSISCFTGPPIGGQLIAYHNGNYLYAQLFGGLSILAGCLTYILVAIKRRAKTVA